MENPQIDRDHPVMRAFREAGYDPDDLVDPATADPDEVRAGGWQAVVYKSHGVERYDVRGVDDENDWSPSGVAAALGREELQMSQPIGLDRPLYGDGFPDYEAIQAAADPHITLLARPGAGDDVPTFSEREAVDALVRYGSEGFVPRGLAEALADAFGADTVDDGVMRDDPDVDGGEMMRASLLARHLGAAIGDARKADSGLGGHKITRRQTFYRNLDALKERVRDAADA